MPRRAADVQWTAALARTVVARIAPEELPAFDVLAAPYLTGADASTDGGRLEFGVLEAVATITPVVTLVSASVTAALLRGAEGELEQLGGRATRGLFGALRRRREPAPPASAPVEFSREQLARVREVAVARAEALGVTFPLAATIADAVVGALLLDREPER
ncbi:hypothetical protein [Micromonospora sp. KC723]|uniref:hypothetical protein n=1 Tax=Micromonospora sp. KC723 TaxID=2530381 RepID=UPI0010442FE1|nr:hypothetical protein [Micromonospora sp. KC723]TDB70500.1 hypothetical protein E1165_25525 [Micromonospora sp. KC723]